MSRWTRASAIHAPWSAVTAIPDKPYGDAAAVSPGCPAAGSRDAIGEAARGNVGVQRSSDGTMASTARRKRQMSPMD